MQLPSGGRDSYFPSEAAVKRKNETCASKTCKPPFRLCYLAVATLEPSGE